MKKIIDWFVHNSVAANLLMMVFVVGGLLVAPTIPTKLFPDIDFLLVTIDVPYPGASPIEVEEGVCIPIEEAIDSVIGIERIRTTAREGHCFVLVDVAFGADGDVVATNMRNKVDNIRNFPDEVERPVVAKLDFHRSVMDIAVSGDMGEVVLKHLAERVRDEMSELDGVSKVDVLYTRDYEISIEVSEESLRRHALSFDQVVRAVRRSSVDMPGGSIKAAGGEILLRTKGQARTGQALEEIVVLSRKDGTRLTLGQVAEINDGFEEVELSAQFDGRPAVLVRAHRVGDEDAVDVSNVVRDYVKSAQGTFPEGVFVTIWRDSSIQLRNRLNMLLFSGASGLALVFVALALFLRFRLAIWVTLGVPIALLGTFIVLPFFNVSLDQVSLFAFILVLGILVDDAIVVGENVYSHEQRSGNRIRAAIEGTQEVAVPVIFGVLTTVAAFSPMIFIPGRMGQIFSFMGVTVIACLFYSLIESQLILPSHLSHGHSKVGGEAKPPKTGVTGWWSRFQDRFAQGLQRFIAEKYRPFLRRAMVWRYSVVAVSVGLLIMTLGVVGGGYMKFSFFPAIEADYVAAQLVMPQGIEIERTREGVAWLEKTGDLLAKEIDAEFAEDGESLVRHRLVSLGHHALRPDNRGPRVDGGHLGEVVLELVPAEDRAISTSEIADRWRDMVGEIPGASELVFMSKVFSAGAPVDFQLRAPANVLLDAVAEDVKERLASYPGVFDIADSMEPGKREIQLELLASAEPLGLTVVDLARQVRQAFYGEEVQRIQRGRDDVKIMVRYPRDERSSLDDLDNLRIRTADGAEVPFWSVARAKLGRGYSDIHRIDRQRVVNVTADVNRSIITSNEVLVDFREKHLPEIMETYPGLTLSVGGEQEDQGKAFAGLARSYPMALLAIFALLAIPLRSYLQPLIIMSVIPFGIVGAVAGHLIMRQTISFSSVMGIVALSGVVVNASLVLVDTVNRQRAAGKSLRDAVELAAASRFRPIVLTAITTFVGLTPLLLGRSVQAKVLLPMATSMAFGVMFATAITLVLVPCSYIIIEDVVRSWRRPRGERPHAVESTSGSHDEAA